MQHDKLKRIVIACGGTGGHFYPGYALAEALRAKGWETLFLLRIDDPAKQRLNQEDLPFVEIDLRGMPRSPSLELMRFPWKLSKSLLMTRNVLRAYHPRCVAGMGGYLTFPAVLSAWWLRIPSLIHEANAVLGLANRLCLPFVSRVALGLPLAHTNNSSSQSIYELTGTPVRRDFWNLLDAASSRRSLGLAPDKTTILVFGGSQGARGINMLAPAALRLMNDQQSQSLQCLHLSGPADEVSVKSAYSGSPIKSVVLPYLQDIHKAYAAADLIISRAGASTLAELIATQKPAILIPFPSATGAHQEINADLLAGAGAALSLRQADLTAANLANAIAGLLSSSSSGQSKLSEMKQQYIRLNLPSPRQSLERLVQIIEEL